MDACCPEFDVERVWPVVNDGYHSVVRSVLHRETLFCNSCTRVLSTSEHRHIPNPAITHPYNNCLRFSTLHCLVAP
jgi:hypothetical protein